MGEIQIRFSGTFGRVTNTFSAEVGGHAAAISRAIKALVDRLPENISRDHALHDNDERPPRADFGMSEEER